MRNKSGAFWVQGEFKDTNPRAEASDTRAGAPRASLVVPKRRRGQKRNNLRQHTSTPGQYRGPPMFSAAIVAPPPTQLRDTISTRAAKSQGIDFLHRRDVANISFVAKTTMHQPPPPSLFVPLLLFFLMTIRDVAHIRAHRYNVELDSEDALII